MLFAMCDQWWIPSFLKHRENGKMIIQQTMVAGKVVYKKEKYTF